jgi:hypothetical protein
MIYYKMLEIILFSINLLMLIIVSAILFYRQAILKRQCDLKIQGIVEQINSINREEYDILKMHENRIRQQYRKISEINENQK